MSGRRSTTYWLPSILLSLESDAGDVRVPFDVKPPGLVLVFARVIDSDSRTCANRSVIQFPIFNPKRVRQQVFAVQLLVDRHRLAKLSGPACDVRFFFRTSAEAPHDIDVIERFQGANQNG